MKINMRYYFILCVLMVFGCMLITGCGKGTSDEELLKALVRDTATLIEKKDVKAALKHFSDDFADDKGNDKKMVKSLLLVQMLRGGKIKIYIRDVKVEVKGDKALLDVRSFVVRGDEAETDIIPDERQGLRMSIVCQKEKGEWKYLSAEWGEVGALGLI